MLIPDFFDRYFRDALPCSFCYGNSPAAPYFGKLEHKSNAGGDDYELYERVFQPDDGNLTAVLKIRRYEKAVEWWLELNGSGEYDSAIIDKLYYADLVSAPSDDNPAHISYPLFHHFKGSLAQIDDFMPATQNFLPEAYHKLQCGGGRCSSGCMPYFNIQMNENHGCIFAIGWNGQWQAEFEKQPGSEKRIHFSASMDKAHFRVLAGETLVLPKMLAMPWQGDVMDSFNAFRRFELEHILPRYNGKPIVSPTFLRTWGGHSMEYHRKKFENMRKHNYRAEIYQIDAAWHGDENSVSSSEDYRDVWFLNVGIWEPMPKLYPDRFKELLDLCRKENMGFSAWFEPERMVSWNKAVREHREYFIGPALPETDFCDTTLNRASYNLMLDLGNPEARRWITDQISKIIYETNMSVFRIDFNYEPLPYWRYNDKEDRIGITEIKYVNGVYAMLDELLERHPGLMIDNCASGGRRLDYRMFRRGIPMVCRSDYVCFADSMASPKQAHTYGLSFLTPVHADMTCPCGTLTDVLGDTYRFRSNFGSGAAMTAPWWELTDEQGAWIRRMFEDAERVRPYFTGDYYPLTGYTLSEKDWMAMQYNHPEEGTGLIMAFRRAENLTPVQCYALRGLDAATCYQLEDLDEGVIGECKGSELMQGISVNIPEKRSARVIFYTKLKDT